MPLCPQCRHANPPGAKFCVECASPITRRCPACGTAAPGDAKFCPECATPLTRGAAAKRRQGAPEPRAAGPSVLSSEAGERRQLTVLFCDLVGSTDLAGRLDPEDYRTIVGLYHDALGAVVARFEGYVAQYLGDGILVYFGWPHAFDDAAERAVRTALELIEAVHALAVPTPLSIRVGIHTGAVVLSEMEHAGHTETLAVGESVNVAARLQAVAAPDTVVISAATLRLVEGLFVVEDLGQQVLKGLRAPVPLYRVVQPSGLRDRLEVSSRHTPLVGRHAELEVLRDAWQRVVDGVGQMVLIQAEAGLGKSRLCHELRERLASEHHTWLECRCSAYSAGTPFRPATELVAQALHFEPVDSPSDKLDKLAVGLARAGFATGEAMPLLAEWLDLPDDAGYPPLEIKPQIKRHKTLEILSAWYLELGKSRPMVMLVEDLHWCDPSTLELLGRLVAQSAPARVLLVGTARPEFATPWPARANQQTLMLGRLNQTETREMIALIVQSRANSEWSTPRGEESRAPASAMERELPAGVIDALVARADGVPLFAEELTQQIAEAGGDGAAAIPVTLQDSLLARLDRLGEGKDVAQRAAVLGREFSYALLAATAGLDENTLQQGLARLVEAELMFVRGVPPQASYTFKHALVQEAAYGSLLKSKRQKLHGAVVDVLMAEGPFHDGTAPEIVARHAEIACRIEDAIAYEKRAGERAQERSAHAEAVAHLRHTIALLGTRPPGSERDAREAALWLTLAGSLVPSRGFAHPEVEEAYEHARVLCETGDDARQLGLALSGLSSACSTRGEVERGGALAARVLAAAEESGDRDLALLGHVGLAFDEYYQGKFASALDHGEAGRRLYQPRRHHALVSSASFDPGVAALSFGAWSLWTLGWADRGLARAREAVALGQLLAHPFSVAEALFYEVAMYWQRRDDATQRERADELIALSEANSFPEFVGVGRAFHAATRVAAGESEAVAELLAGLTLTAETGSQAGAPGILALLGEAYMAAAQLTESRGAVESGLAVAAATGQTFFDADLHRVMGDCLLAEPDDRNQKKAEDCFQRALAMARAQDAKSFEVRAALSLARLWRDQNKRAAARDLLAPIHAWFTEGFATRDLVDAKALLEELQ